MDKRTGRHIKRISREQEKQAAADVGGKVQKNSGALRLGGGADVRVAGHTRIECKVTEKHNFVLKKSELLKLWHQAAGSLETPVFQIAFKNAYGRLEKYAVVNNMPSTEEEDFDFYHLDTHYNSVSLPQDYLRGCLRAGRILVTFRDGLAALTGRQWEIVTWAKYLESRGEE